MKKQAMLLCDFYKVSHKALYPKGTELIYSTFTPRSSKLSKTQIEDVTVFGIQHFVKEYLINFFNEQFFSQPKQVVVNDYERFLKHTLGLSVVDSSHIAALHDLGYLPLEIKALDEGTQCPIKIPVLTIQNTLPEFFWLTNYIETLMSCELWQPMTSATIAREFYKTLSNYANLTGGDLNFVPFQGHDFSMRGMSSLSSAISSGMGHLVYFTGTDTIPAISALEEYYEGNIERELLGTSIPASEHSIQSAYQNDERYIHDIITNKHPEGFVSLVSDGYDFWNVVTNILPKLKTTIMARNGRLVVRPDSGDPVKIVIGDAEANTEWERKGLIECLWDTFGGTVNSKGFKELDTHIGAIYGDSITLERATLISQGLMDKGFASTNIVYGIGSYTYQYNTRDTLGFALKSTLAKINGEEITIFKDPKTDNGTKKSAKGAVAVVKQDGKLVLLDNMLLEQANAVENNLLTTVFKDGRMVKETSISLVRMIAKGETNET